MKKNILKFFTMFAILFGTLTTNAQIIIKVRPGPPVVRVRPVSPGPRHIWINGEYILQGNRYIYTDGYWAVPPPNYRYWKEGHWKKRRGGWIWIRGHWR